MQARFVGLHLFAGSLILEKNNIKQQKQNTNITKKHFKTAAGQARLEKTTGGSIMQKFDLIVIGGGPGGYLCAERAGKAGLRPAPVSYTHLKIHKAGFDFAGAKR